MPVPAVKGGAVSTLIESILKENEEKIGAYEEGICMMKYNEIMIRRQPEEG